MKSFLLGNPGFLSEVKFYEGENYFLHPLDTLRKVYILPDAPHLIKVNIFKLNIYTKIFYVFSRKIIKMLLPNLNQYSCCKGGGGQ